MKTRRTKAAPLIIAALIFITLGTSFSYAGYVAESLAKESAMHLEEVATQGAALVAKQSRSDIDILRLLADGLMADVDVSVESRMDFMRTQADKHEFFRLGYVDAAGNGITTDGYTFSAVDSAFFKASMGGKEYIGGPVADAIHPEASIIVFSIPIARAGQIEGVIFGNYTSEVLMNVINVSFYGQEQSAQVINSVGDIVMYPTDGRRGDNLFEAAGPGNSEDVLRGLREGLKSGSTGGAQLVLDGVDYFVSCAPIGINDWFLLSSVEADVVFHRSEGVIAGTMIFISCIAMLCGLVLIYIFTSRKKANTEIAKLAYYDTLTGAPNVEKFRQDARSLIHRHGAGRYLLLYIDTRHFRYFNRDFGYEAGDEYLMYTANVLRESIVGGEAFARTSGDMFVLLCRCGDSHDTGMERWIQIRDRIMNCHIVVESRYALRLNCGVYRLNREVTNIQTAIDRANIARKSLKDRYDTDFAVYNSDMQMQIDHEKEVEQCMHAALENDEFTPYMQPKYSLCSGRVVGAEALVRWIKPDGIIVPPDEFIPLFEKNGFVSELDLYMLESVCSHMREQIDTGLSPVPTSINQSRCYMYSPDYVETICAIIDKYRIPPHLIEFEITENIAYKNMDKLILVIEKLNANGFHLSLDDFGSGYSSLNVLKDLKVDVLKLDRVFLGQTIDTERGKTVVANIIRMAKELRIDVVAEGVETIEQVDFLKSSNCDMAQGFYFSRPIPMKEFEALLRAQEEAVTV